MTTCDAARAREGAVLFVSNVYLDGGIKPVTVTLKIVFPK